MSFIKFPSIEQYRHLIKQVQEDVSYSGRDENNKPIYDSSKVLPTLKFCGTVKLHGTNAGVCYNKKNGIYSQSRNRVLTLDKDNSGFCAFVTPLKTVFETMLQTIPLVDEKTCAVFGEWCGDGIMKGVGIAKVPKMFVIFAVVLQGKNENDQIWLDKDEVAKLKSPQHRIFNIYDYQTFTIDINFNNPESVQQQLIDITNQIEKECPVALAHGVKNGVGEGIVWTQMDSTQPYRMKVKGDEHRVTTSKTSAPVKPETQESVDEFVKNAVSKQRLEQGIQELFTSEKKKATLQDTLAFVKWIQADILKEEKDTLETNNLNQQQTIKAIGDVARKWFKVFLESS